MSANCISVRDVRHFIWDRTVADNRVSGKLAFTDEEIREAMKNAARAYNSVAPTAIKTGFTCLDGTTDVFLHGTVYHLYIGRLSMMQRNALSHSAGGVTVELDKVQINYMMEMLPKHKDAFEATAKTLKVTENINRAYGRPG